MNPWPLPTLEIRRLRTLQPVVLSLVLFSLAAPITAQLAPDAKPEAQKPAQSRGQKVSDLRHLIAGLDLGPWRQFADLLVEVTPHQDGSASFELIEIPRPRLVNVPSLSAEASSAWRLPDGSRLIFLVDSFGRVQEVGCAVPEILRSQPVTLGIFWLFGNELACFVRPAA
jgi:hypothetical protein